MYLCKKYYIFYSYFINSLSIFVILDSYEINVRSAVLLIVQNPLAGEPRQKLFRILDSKHKNRRCFSP